MAQGGLGGMGWHSGKVIQESASDYHSRTQISASRMKDFIASPRGYYRQHISNEAKGRETAAMTLGSAVHEEVLLEIWEREWIVIPDEVLAKNGAKSGNAWKEYAAKNEGRLLLKSSEVKQAEEMMNAIKKHPLASKILDRDAAGAQTEITVSAVAEVLGCDGLDLKWFPVPVRGRLDYLVPSRIGDLKTTGDLSPKSMKFRPWDLGWDIQGQWYRKLVHSIFGDWVDIDFVVVESSEPYRVEVWTPTKLTLEAADEKIEAGMKELLACNMDWASSGDENAWNRPGYDVRNLF